MKKDNKTTTDQQCHKTAVSGSVILPTHLRIGNIVNLLTGEDEFYEIRFFDDETISFKDYISWDFIGYDEIEAIPLTEELLLKVGAIKLDFKDFPSFNLFGLQINFINGLWIEYVSRVEVKGLHHLQNIFYFRNSEELNVLSLTDR